MSTILVFREQLQGFYANYSGYITKGLKFILGLLVFWMINSNIGFMKAASSTAWTVGLAVACAFLPQVIMVLAATALVLLHLYTLSLGVAIVAGLLFLLMYIFYFRFAVKKAWLILLMAVSCGLKLPLAVPVAIGLLGSPACLVPAVCGTFTYYMLHLVKTTSSSLKGGSTEELIEILMTFTKQIFTNKEMLVMVGAVVLCVLLVYGIRTRSVDHSWKIASVTGAVASVGVCVAGNIVLNVQLDYTMMVAGAIVSILSGLLLEVLFMSVDYSRTEYLEFEDEEYHYYVKAVPKLVVTVPEKNVKQITRHQGGGGVSLPQGQAGRGGIREGQRSKAHETGERAEDILLTRSLNKELGIESSKKGR